MKLRTLLLISALLMISLVYCAQTPCLGFSGSGYAVVDNNTALNPTNVTVEAWLYLDSVSSRPHIVGKGSSVTGAYWLVIETTAKPRFYFTVGNSGSWQFVEGSSSVSTGQWFHIAGTYNGSQAIIYINGVQAGQKNASPLGNLKTNDNYPLYIARSYQAQTATPNNYLSGKIDEVRVWNYARTSTQINTNMNNEISVPQTGLIGYWRMNEGSGTTISDISGNNLTGSLNGTTNWVQGPETLPVELSSFTAVLMVDNMVRIMWITQSETNLRGYYVFRGETNDLSEAQIVSPLIEPNNTSSQSTYTYLDEEITTQGTYYYWLESFNLDGTYDFYGPVSVTLNGSEPNAPEIEILTGLLPVYPNPFNPTIHIPYKVDNDTQVEIKIFNTKGQLVRTWDQGLVQKGTHKVIWNGMDNKNVSCSSGVYLIKMQAGNQSFSTKAILSK